MENSSVGVGWRWASAEFIAAETVLEPAAPRLLPLSHPWREPLLYLSREAAWLPDHPTLAADQLTLRKRYKVVLAEQGLVSYTGVVKAKRLLQAFADFYPADLLAWLHCPLDGPVKVPWPGRLMREGDRTVQHPLRHLLFMHFLGHTSQTFFALPLERHPFGQGPWPCLNPVCPHYHHPVIGTYRLERRHHTRPVATFSCDCGYQYRRQGPDRTEADRFRGKCVAYGPVWDTELQRLWQDPSQSMARVLNL